MNISLRIYYCNSVTELNWVRQYNSINGQTAKSLINSSSCVLHRLESKEHTFRGRRMKIQSMIPIALYVRHRVGVRSSEVLADVAVNRDIVVRGDEVVKVREEEGACLGLVVTNGHCKWRRQRLSCIPCSRGERRTLHKSEIAKALLLLRFVLCGGGGESDRNDTPSHLVGWLPSTDRWMAKLLLLFTAAAAAALEGTPNCRLTITKAVWGAQQITDTIYLWLLRGHWS